MFKFDFAIDNDGVEQQSDAMDVVVESTTAQLDACEIQQSQPTDQEAEISPQWPPVPSLVFDVAHVYPSSAALTESKEPIVLLRRQLSDIQYQLALTDPLTNNNNNNNNNTATTNNMESAKQTNANNMANEVVMCKLPLGGGPSDLIKGIYEGGLKTWECSNDLVQYLHSQPLGYFNGKTVLELGCGSALPSLYLLSKITSDGNGDGKGPKLIVMQDFNKEVIEMVTVPNALANTSVSHELARKCNVEEYATQGASIELDLEDGKIEEYELDQDEIEKKKQREQREQGEQKEHLESGSSTLSAEELASWKSSTSNIVSSRCKFFSGDWARLNTLLHSASSSSGSEDGYDVILTSETIYELSSQQSLYSLIKATLSRKPTSVALVAAKSIYFGLSGSMFNFRQMVEADGQMNIRVVRMIDAYVKREIVELTWRL